MSNQNSSKINHLLGAQPPGTVLSSAWLLDQGYSYDLQKRYRQSQWFDSIGTGALIRHNDDVDYLGAIFALQNQLGLSVHPAAKTALSLQGKSHYLEFSTQSVQLFGSALDRLPQWFKKRNWDVALNYHPTAFLPPELGLVSFKHKSFTVKISGPARAVMECLYLAPKAQPLQEAFELMEGLNNLRPTDVQALLEGCNSVKVKRLFLYMAEKAGHDWLGYVNLDAVDLGSGKRVLAERGVYVAKYQITVPEELDTMHG